MCLAWQVSQVVGVLCGFIWVYMGLWPPPCSRMWGARRNPPPTKGAAPGPLLVRQSSLKSLHSRLARPSEKSYTFGVSVTNVFLSNRFGLIWMIELCHYAIDLDVLRLSWERRLSTKTIPTQQFWVQRRFLETLLVSKRMLLQDAHPRFMFVP